MLIVIAALASPQSAHAADGEWSASMVGGAFLAHRREVVGSSAAFGPRVGYWPHREWGIELDVPFLWGGRTKIAEENAPWGGALPNLGVVARAWKGDVASLMLSASAGASFRGVQDARRLGVRPYDHVDLDLAFLAGPSVMWHLTDDWHLRTEWRGIAHIGPINHTEDFGRTRDVFLNALATVGVTWLPMGADDADGDGISDEIDACIDQPEDVDGFEDADGCPDPDNDGDTIADGDDRCPVDAEDLDGFEDADGCPDPDNDGDGVLDVDDSCPGEVGDAKAFGCPDRDGDRVPDFRDQCPDKPSPKGIDPLRDDGCPRKYFIAQDKIVILEQVQFLTGRATIQRSSFELLDGVADVLVKHAGVKRVQVEGHTDSEGSEASNQTLSQARAEAVAAYLAGKGVEAERLVAVGFGESKPIADNATAEGRQKNRRVEFNILEQDPPKPRRRQVAPKQ